MEELILELKQQLIEVLNLEEMTPEDIDAEAPLFGDGLGLDSIDALEIIVLLEKKYGRLFLRCHQSYLVNPDYITNIRRFKLTLSDGTELPIPEKKYTAFRNKAVSIKTELIRYFDHKKRLM